MLRLSVPVRYGTWEIACERPKHSLVSNTFCLPRIILNVTIFQKPQLQSVILFSKFVHQCHLLYLMCYLYFLFMFWAVIFMFHSILWQLQLLEFWVTFVTTYFFDSEGFSAPLDKKEAFCATKVNLVTYFQFCGEFTFFKKSEFALFQTSLILFNFI